MNHTPFPLSKHPASRAPAPPAPPSLRPCAPAVRAGARAAESAAVAPGPIGGPAAWGGRSGRRNALKPPGQRPTGHLRFVGITRLSPRHSSSPYTDKNLININVSHTGLREKSYSPQHHIGQRSPESLPSIPRRFLVTSCHPKLHYPCNQMNQACDPF